MRLVYASAVIALLLGSGAASADLLWDNFLTNNNGHGYDGRSYIISETDATVPSGAWAADDVSFTQSVTVQKVRWAGADLASFTYTPQVEILNSDYSVRNAFTTLGSGSLSTLWQGSSLIFGQFTPYNAEVSIPSTVLPPGHYFIAVRLVNLVNGALGAGRNVFLTTGNTQLNPNAPSMALIQAPDFYFQDFVPVNQYYGAPQTDLAFQVYGTPVPEPASLGLMLLGLAGALIRRR